MAASTWRQLCFLSLLIVSILFFYSKSLRTKVSSKIASLEPLFRNNKDRPDLEQYVPLNTLTSDEFPIDDPSRRVIAVGDIHGMSDDLHKLLKKLSYDPTSDVLIHVGDIVAKGPHKGSMEVISYMAKNNVTGVRGNHDQKVIEWRAWLDWIRLLPGGSKWISKAHASWQRASSKGIELEDWLHHQHKHVEDSSHPDARWWRRLPSRDWILFGDHYDIATALSQEEYSYLLNLPLCLHIPSAHTFVAHAGLLPEDLRYKTNDRRQPLATVPALPRSDSDDGESAVRENDKVVRRLRAIQESKLLHISHNEDPYVVLNVRSIVDRTPVRDSNEGTPWTELWNRDMNLCSGFSSSRPHAHTPSSLPCYPSTLLYGHAASRGLDINRWSIGLDSGCVYGRKLTAVVLGRAARGSPKSQLYPIIAEELQTEAALESGEGQDEYELLNEDSESQLLERKKKTKSRIHYGDTGHGRLVHVNCY